MLKLTFFNIHSLAKQFWSATVSGSSSKPHGTLWYIAGGTVEVGAIVWFPCTMSQCSCWAPGDKLVCHGVQHVPLPAKAPGFLPAGARRLGRVMENTCTPQLLGWQNWKAKRSHTPWCSLVIYSNAAALLFRAKIYLCSLLLEEKWGKCLSKWRMK